MVALIPFATNYFCESGCSSLLIIKTKSTNRLDAKDDMCIAWSKTTPQFHILTEDKQQQTTITLKKLGQINYVC